MSRYLSVALIGSLLAASVASADAGAVVSEEREVEAVRPWASKRIERLHEDLRDEKLEYVFETLDEMKSNHRLNSHEKALMWQGYGYAYLASEDYKKAADALARCIETQGLPFTSELAARYNRAQLLVMLEQPQAAIAEFDIWFVHAKKPSPTAYYMAAMAYMQDGQPRLAVEYVDRAIATASAPKEAWLQLKNAMLVEEKDYEAAEAVLGRLIELYPKKAYWMQLAAIYSQTDRQDRALTTLEMVYMQGMLDEESERLTLAQMYLFNQIPYRAAEVVRDGLDAGVVKESARSWQLLADSWLHARERDRALVAMRKAAELAEDGNVYVRLAQLLVGREEWSEARHALEHAVDKGNLRHPGHAQLLLGIANVNEQRWGPARRALSAAKRDEKTQKAAEYWLSQLTKQQRPPPESPRV